MQRLQAITRHLRSATPVQMQTSRMMSTNAAAAATTEPPVRITPHPNGSLTLSLHRPKALNALSKPMVDLLTEGLLTARKQQSRCVLVYGEGDRAFCAGGDIRALAFPKEPQEPHAFFRAEYRMNHLIHTSPMPYCAILRGITMGGGVGISVHGKVRIVTDNTVFAMPETGIGLFPDVGGTWFLPRLPGATGMYLALTGQSLGPVDTLFAGVGTHFIPLSSIPSFIESVETSNDSLDTLLQRFSTKPPESLSGPNVKLPPFLAQRRELIDKIFTAQSYEEVEKNLERELAASKDEGEKAWLAGVKKQLSTKSPTSLMITFHAMQLGRSAPTLADCLRTELRLGTRITAEGANGDFSEGVKAIVVDKKHKPQWRPRPTLEEVKSKYFAPFTKEEDRAEFEPIQE